MNRINLTKEMVRERQQTMLAEAAAGRDAVRARSLARATRRAERAERQLTRSWHKAARLRSELAAAEHSP
jgi:hypothetical protein